MIKSTKHVILLLIICLGTVSCSTSAPFLKTTDGFHSTENYELEILEKSIMLSLVRFNWVVTDTGSGIISARYSKSDGLIIADIEIFYSQEGYSISYIDSKNLDVNLKRMKIHKNYNRWIANLNKSIFEKYIELDT